ncbi:MAG: rhodanese-like domain-containing protein [Betaproteobacteria bacterium]
MTMHRRSGSASQCRAALACVLVAGVFSSGTNAQNYPPPQNYPPQQQPQGYPPPPSGYPPQGYPSQQPSYPPQQGGYAPAQPGYAGGQQAPQSLDQLMAWERQDVGVAPTRTLHTGAMHGPTPNQIPGGQVITTKGLVALLQNQKIKPLVLDILGSSQQLPDAQSAVPASQPGGFDDQTQQQFGQYLQQATHGSKEMPIVLYCQGPQCWMSYNAALRAINLGYKNVLWYRGGIEAWERAGLPFANARMAAQQPPGNQGGAPGGYPGGQPGGKPGGYPGGQPGGYPGGQPGGYPQPSR